MRNIALPNFLIAVLICLIGPYLYLPDKEEDADAPYAYMIVTADSTALKKGVESNDPLIVTLYKGDCVSMYFVYSETNEKYEEIQHYFIKTQSGTEGYVYSQDLQFQNKPCTIETPYLFTNKNMANILKINKDRYWPAGLIIFIILFIAIIYDTHIVRTARNFAVIYWFSAPLYFFAFIYPYLYTTIFFPNDIKMTWYLVILMGILSIVIYKVCVYIVDSIDYHIAIRQIRAGQFKRKYRLSRKNNGIVKRIKQNIARGVYDKIPEHIQEKLDDELSKEISQKASRNRFSPNKIMQFIEQGANFKKVFQGSLTPIMNALPSQKIMLMELGADLNVRDTNGTTPFMHAVEDSSALVLHTMIRAGADLTAQDNKGHTALDYFNRTSRPFTKFEEGIIFETLNYACNLNQQDKEGKTCIMHIIKDHGRHGDYKASEKIKALIKAGADVGIEDKKGHNALYYAESELMEKTVAVLKEALDNKKDKSSKYDQI